MNYFKNIFKIVKHLVSLRHHNNQMKTPESETDCAAILEF